jgi:hypothetical protein
MEPESNEAQAEPSAKPSPPEAANPGFTPVGGSSPPFVQAPKPRLSTNEIIRRSVLAITLGVLAIAILIFLAAINSVIDVWLRDQWVPIARAVVALGVVAICLVVLSRFTRDRR